MEITDRQELLSFVDNINHWAKVYESERVTSAKAKSSLILIMAAELDDIKAFKSNFSFDTAIMFLLKDFTKPIHQEIQSKYNSYLISEAKYKGAEKICEALTEKINAIKFINREIR